MVAEMNWDTFQRNIPENQTSQKEIPETSEEKKNLSWGEFQTPSTYQGEPEPTENESTFSYLARNVVSNVARAGERFLGKYGDVEKGLKVGLSKFPASAGLLGEAIQSLIGQENWDQMIGVNKQMYPTSEDIKKITMEATGEYTKPKTKREKIAQEFSADVGSMGRATGLSQTRRLAMRLGIPAAANAAKETVEWLGFGEDSGSWTKLAAMTALSFFSGVNAPVYAAQLMNRGRQGYGANVAANIPRYERGVNASARNMLQGDPRSALAQQQIAGIRNDMASGQTTMGDLMNRYDAINAAKRDRGLFELGRADRRAAIRNIDQVRHAVRDEIRTIGAANPGALENWENGVRAFSTIHRSNALSNTANRLLTGPMAKAAVGTLFGVGGGLSVAKTPLIAGSAALAAPAAYKAGQVAYRVWADPVLANYYWQAMRGLAAEDGAMFLANYEKLDKAYKKKTSQQSN